MNQFLTRNRLADPVIICIFLVALFAPLLTWLTQKNVDFSEAEKRALQPFPTVSKQASITEFTHAFDGYFKDHFGFRNWLIHRYQREVNKRFGQSGVSHVVNGLDGWLFLTGEGVLEDLQGNLRFTQDEEQLFWNILAQKKAWIEQRGIAYLFMVAPNKQSIYPEYHPRFYEQAKKSSRFDHLLAAKPEQGRAELLDVRANLKQGKPVARLYQKTDTHWNYQGAYLVYQAVMKRIYPMFPGLNQARDFTFIEEWRDKASGDLAMMSGQRKSMREQAPELESSDFIYVRQVMSEDHNNLLNLRQLKPLYTRRTNSRLRVLVLHDSFFNYLKPFVSESFGEVLYVWQYYDSTTLDFFNRDKLSALLDIYQPDLVIEETVERYLGRFLITNDHDWKVSD